MAAPSWCTIESDPGVFTELIAQIGVKGVQVEELVDLENETFNRLKPILGLVFLFKWQDEKKADAAAERGRIVLEGDTPGVFFAQQVINNACATQAILNILLNRPELDLGTEIAGFKSFTEGLPADMRGLAMSNSEAIRSQHNSFARPEPFVFEEKKSKGDDDDDVFHFIGYVPIGGNLYELDGLQRGPILLGECTSENWLEKVRPVIQARIAKYTSKEIRFALMAIVRNRTDVANERLAAIAKRREQLMAVLTGAPAPAPAAAGASATGMDTSEDLPTDPEAVTVALGNLEDEEKTLEATIESEKSKFAAWKLENVRRKHNYVPFIFNLLKSLAEKGKLNGLVESSAKATVERVAKARAEKEKRAAAKREATAAKKP